ncbi:hypothetical protein BDW22DRAFT_1350281 [Trametopsis cervina]|nr:hypothetical protein BDW22DRAFT_1350281 [Trametopsis cervina]
MSASIIAVIHNVFHVKCYLTFPRTAAELILIFIWLCPIWSSSQTTPQSTMYSCF